MGELTILRVVTLFVIFISFFFTVFLFTVKTEKRLSNILIGLYLIIIPINISVFFYYPIYQAPPILDVLRNHILYLSSPLLFLYVLSSIYNDFKLRSIHLLHLIPFIFILLVYFPRFFGATLMDRNDFYAEIGHSIEFKIDTYFGYLVVVFYMIWIFIELAKYKKVILENFSNQEHFNYKWLFQLNLLGVFLFLFSVFKSIYIQFGSDSDFLSLLRILITISLLSFICWIVLKSMYYPELFRGLSSNYKPLIKAEEEKKDKEKVATQEDLYAETIEMVKKHMEDAKPYLDPSLTVQDLADQLQMAPRDLSILINHHLNQHFFDFINRYRIETAKEILKDPANKKLTVLEILYQVGFNSKSSFNTAFKKHTGSTPTQFKSTHS